MDKNDPYDTTTITRQEYKELKHAQAVLNALYAGGVDNWEWYGDSLELIEEEA